MHPAAIPFDYVQYLDTGDRLRRTRARPNGSRVRRGARRNGEAA